MKRKHGGPLQGDVVQEKKSIRAEGRYVTWVFNTAMYDSCEGMFRVKRELRWYSCFCSEN